LGALHEEGILVSKDVSFSIDCYKRATEAPFTPLSVSSLAHYLVGIKYRLGDLGLGRDYVIALKHLTLSADAGYVPALRALGLMYSEGIGVPQDKRKANDLFQKAASQGDIRSLGLMTTHQVSKKRKSTTSSAVTLYEKAAKAGSLSSQLSLAELLQYSGQYALAFQWFQTAASDLLSNEQEDKISVLDLSVGFITQRNIARLMVARYIYNGWGGVIRDRMRAFKEFESLSKAGFSDAHYWLAACYEEGVTEDEDTMAYVVEPDLKRAYGIYMQSAKAGDVDGQFQIAYMMSNSIGCTKNLEDALVWYTRAAEQGHTMAQLSVGMYYEHGLVNPIDLDIAKKWYQLAAANNETKAMVKLAKVLVELDHIQDAFQWLRKAIDGGNVPALRELANLYINSLTNEKNESLSVTQRHRLAFGYYQKAAEKNDALSWHALSKFYEGSYEEDEDEAIVPVSFEKAVMCLTKAEELGCST
jgi:TPR repeat protein